MFLSAACKHQSAEIPEEDFPRDTVLPDDFLEFYRTFHSDSVYQFAHITFPLKGILQDATGGDSAVTWTADTWKLHRPIPPGDGWNKDYTIPMSGIIIEYIHANQGALWMQRRFAKLDTAWYLIYYEGMRFRLRG